MRKNEKNLKLEKKLKKKVLVSEKKISSETEIGPWFPFVPDTNPGFSRTISFNPRLRLC